MPDFLIYLSFYIILIVTLIGLQKQLATQQIRMYLIECVFSLSVHKQ